MHKRSNQRIEILLVYVFTKTAAPVHRFHGGGKGKEESNARVVFCVGLGWRQKLSCHESDIKIQAGPTSKNIKTRLNMKRCTLIYFVKSRISTCPANFERTFFLHLLSGPARGPLQYKTAAIALKVHFRQAPPEQEQEREKKTPRHQQFLLRLQL